LFESIVGLGTVVTLEIIDQVTYPLPPLETRGIEKIAGKELGAKDWLLLRILKIVGSSTTTFIVKKETFVAKSITFNLIEYVPELTAVASRNIV
jgi:hypothetical protein